MINTLINKNKNFNALHHFFPLNRVCLSPVDAGDVRRFTTAPIYTTFVSAVVRLKFFNRRNRSQPQPCDVIPSTPSPLSVTSLPGWPPNRRNRSQPQGPWTAREWYHSKHKEDTFLPEAGEFNDLIEFFNWKCRGSLFRKYFLLTNRGEITEMPAANEGWYFS